MRKRPRRFGLGGRAGAVAGARAHVGGPLARRPDGAGNGPGCLCVVLCACV